MVIRALIPIEMKKTLLPGVKLDAFPGRPRKKMVARRNSKACGLDGVVAVLGYGGHELQKLGDFVPARLWIDQERSIPLKHPLEAFEDC